MTYWAAFAANYWAAFAAKKDLSTVARLTSNIEVQILSHLGGHALVRTGRPVRLRHWVLLLGSDLAHVAQWSLARHVWRRLICITLKIFVPFTVPSAGTVARHEHLRAGFVAVTVGLVPVPVGPVHVSLVRPGPLVPAGQSQVSIVVT